MTTRADLIEGRARFDWLGVVPWDELNAGYRAERCEDIGHELDAWLALGLRLPDAPADREADRAVVVEAISTLFGCNRYNAHGYLDMLNHMNPAAKAALRRLMSEGW